VHVVGHYHPGTEFIELPLSLSSQNGVRHQIGDPRVLEPERPQGDPIQGAVLSDEGVARTGVYRGVCAGRRQ